MNLDKLNNLILNVIASQDKASEERRISQAKTDEQMKALREDLKKTEKQMKKDHKMLIGMGVTSGLITEDIIAENFADVFREENIKQLFTNLRYMDKTGRVIAEFDIVAVNSTKIFICESKSKLTEEHINKFMTHTLPQFKKYAGLYYKGLSIYGVLGLRVFGSSKVKELAKSKGLYLIKEYHNGKAILLKDSIESAREM